MEMICICCGLVTCAISEVRSSTVKVNPAVENGIVEMKKTKRAFMAYKKLNDFTRMLCLQYLLDTFFKYRLLKIFLSVGLKQSPALVVCFKN